MSGHFTHPKILTSIAACEILQDILIDINSGNRYSELLSRAIRLWAINTQENEV